MSGGQDWAAELISTSGGGMRDMTIAEFCDLHNACWEGFKWAMENCRTMQDVWNLVKPEWLIWVATREGVLADKTLRLFGCWSVRQVWHLLTDERSRHAVEVAERYASGCATDEELAAAMDAAWDAAWAAAMDAALDTASAVAWDAARAAAWAAARDAAWDAASAAARAAASAAVLARAAAARGAEARAAAWDAARADQAEWLRQHTKPCFARVPAVVKEAERAAG